MDAGVQITLRQTEITNETSAIIAGKWVIVPLSVMTPPMVGPTWPRVRFTLGSDCLPVLSQGTALLLTASLRLDYGLTAFIVTARIRCLVIGVVLVCHSLTCLCGPEGYTFDYMYVHVHGSVYPMMDCTSRV